MPFQFSLAAVLRLREGVERREERALQKLQLEVSRLTLRVEELAEQSKRTHDTQTHVLEQPVAACHLHALQSALMTIEENRRALLAEIQRLKQERDRQMTVYQAARRDRELLAQMKANQFEVYEKYSRRQEQKKLDDIFISRRGR